MKALFLPAITGMFSKWRYYQIIMKVSDIVECDIIEDEFCYRVKTVDEVAYIYSEKGVSNLLQRAYEIRRLNPIKEYLLKQPDSYLNNITVAIFEGKPSWLPINLQNIGFKNLKEDEIEELGKSFGVIHLTGKEILFVLDGQHRLKALRAAVETKTKLLEQEIAVTLITHQHTAEGKKRTRRLFSTINRHAKPVSEGENILLDEDDVSAIVARKMIEDYPLFRGKEIVALNKTANLTKSDKDKLTTVISLWNINETLIDHSSLYSNKIKNQYLKIRPDESLIEKQTQNVFHFWHTFFQLFPAAKDFVSLNGRMKKDQRENGGPYYLRPIGQEIIAIVYKKLIDEGHKSKIKYLASVERDLDSKFWHHVLFNPYKKTMYNKKNYGLHYFMYNFGFELTKKQIANLKQNYKKNSGELELDLPKPKYNFL